MRPFFKDIFANQISFMKRIILSAFAFLIVGISAFFTNVETGNTHAAGAPAFTSGSPYDRNTCAEGGCHTTYAAQQAPLGWISSNIPSAGYVPGTTYTITCKAVSKTSGENSNFGFECTPQNSTTGAVVGALANIITSGAGSTQIISSLPSEWMTQTSSSYTGTDSCVWSFKWTAPGTGVGAVNFYACFNCGSIDKKKTGQIYRDSVHFPQDSTTGINPIEANFAKLNIYPNPVKTDFTISYSLMNAGRVTINLYSLDGKKITGLMSENMQTPGTFSNKLEFPANIPTGIYIIQLNQEGQSACKEIIKQ